MRRRWRVVGVWVLAVALPACTREGELVERFVERYCEARWSCGCESPGLTQVHCESQLTLAGDEAQAAAQDAGLTYDRECAKAWLDAIDDSCSVEPTPSAGSRCGEPCLPYYGSKAQGEPCETFGPWSDCGRGLLCGLTQLCVDPCSGQREGDICDYGDAISTCAPGLACISGGVCGPPPALGEACRTRCAPGGMCDQDTQICVDAPGFGEPCGDFDTCGRNLRCTPERVCDVGVAKVCGLGAPW